MAASSGSLGKVMRCSEADSFRIEAISFERQSGRKCSLQVVTAIDPSSRRYKTWSHVTGQLEAWASTVNS